MGACQSPELLVRVGFNSFFRLAFLLIKNLNFLAIKI